MADGLPWSISYFTPTETARSAPSISSTITPRVRAAGCPVYLVYRVNGSRKMNYNSAFQPRASGPGWNASKRRNRHHPTDRPVSSRCLDTITERTLHSAETITAGLYHRDRGLALPSTSR